jgi:hypothetical protein
MLAVSAGSCASCHVSAAWAEQPLWLSQRAAPKDRRTISKRRLPLSASVEKIFSIIVAMLALPSASRGY